MQFAQSLMPLNFQKIVKEKIKNSGTLASPPKHNVDYYLTTGYFQQCGLEPVLMPKSVKIGLFGDVPFSSQC
jgi:hypothetical protein